MKKALVCVLMLLFAVPAVSQSVYFNGSFDDAISSAQREGKQFMAFFYSNTWGGCVLLDQQFFSNDQYHDYLTENFVIYRASQQNESDIKIFDRYETGTEALIFTDHQGVEVERIAGYSPPEEFVERVKKAHSGENSFETLLALHKKDKSNFDVNLKLAVKYAQTFRWDQANDFFDRVMKNPEKARNTTVNYVVDEKVVVPVNELALAIKVYESPEVALEFMKEYPESRILERTLKGLRAHLQNNDKNAESVAEELLKMYSTEETLISAYMAYLISNEKFDKALKTAEKLYPNPEVKNNGVMVTNYVDLLAQTEQFDKMSKVASEFLNNNKGDENFYYNLYIIYNDNELYKEAFSTLDEAVKLYPDYIYLKYAYGKTSAVSGMRQDDALKYLAEFVEQAHTAKDDNAQFNDPTWYSAGYWRMGMIHERKDETADAIKMYEMALKVDPTRVEAEEALKRLKK